MNKQTNFMCTYLSQWRRSVTAVGTHFYRDGFPLEHILSEFSRISVTFAKPVET